MSDINWFQRPQGDRTDIMGSGFPEPTPRNRSKLPPNAQAIHFMNGSSSMPSGFYRVPTNGGFQYIDANGDPLTGRELDEARRLDAEDRERGRAGAPREGSQSNAMQQSGGMTADQAAERSGGLREEAEGRRSEMSRSNIERVSFNSYGDALVEVPASLRNATGTPTVSFRNAMQLDPDTARQIYEQTFSKPVPANMSPQQALSEELRNMRRE